MKHGFGSSSAGHVVEFGRALRDLAESLQTAEGLHRNGMCHALMDEAARAFRLEGEMEEHRKYVSKAVREKHVPERIRLGAKLNFLRQHMKSCIAPGSD